jgi:cell wall-associated NlpC family hydrolase
MPVRTLVPALPPRPLRSLTVVTRALTAVAVAAALLLTVSPGPLAPSGQSGQSGRQPAVDADIRPVAARATKVRRSLSIAKNQIGDRYRYGAAGPHRFDCSGLVYFSARKAGFSGVPRTSAQQSRHMKRIKRSRMRPGDYLFFHNSSGVYHVAIFLGWKDGRRRILHAPGSGQRVKKNVTWTSRWFAGTLR